MAPSRFRVLEGGAVLRGNTNAPTIAVAERAADLIAGRPLLLPPADPA